MDFQCPPLNKGFTVPYFTPGNDQEPLATQLPFTLAAPDLPPPPDWGNMNMQTGSANPDKKAPGTPGDQKDPEEDPKDPEDDQPVKKFNFYGAAASLGAMVNSLIINTSDTARRSAREARQAKTLTIIENLKAQEASLREQAEAQLRSAIAGGVLQMCQGLAGGVTMFLGRGEPIQGSTYAKSVSDLIGGGVTIAQGVGQAQVTEQEAERKSLDALIEQARAMQDLLKDLEDAMKKVIETTLNAMNAIQSSTNQTRKAVNTMRV